MPESSDQFLCPVCKNIITKVDLEQDPYKISIAHIIPKSMHGRLITLACAKCDKRIGGDFDRHLSIEKKLIDQLREEKGIHCRIKCGSETYGAMFGISNKSNDEIYIKPQGNVPFPIWKERMDKLINLNIFSLNLRLNPFDPQKRNISHIYSAFLFLFSKFGYEYALSPNVDQIREVLVGNDSLQNIHKLVMDLPSSLLPTQIPSINILVNPKETRTFFITLPSPKPDKARCVFLPGFGKSGEEGYHNLVNLIGTQLKLDAEFKTFLMPNCSSYLSDIRFKGFGNWIWDALMNKADFPETTYEIGQGFRLDWN
jgi:hypothetical protein